MTERGSSPPEEKSPPGEKGPPAWERRSEDSERRIPDEPPDSSSEVDQEQGLPPAPGRSDEDGDG